MMIPSDNHKSLWRKIFLVYLLTLSELELKLMGSAGFEPAASSAQGWHHTSSDNDPQYIFMLHGIVRGHNFKFVWSRQYLYIELGHTGFNGFFECYLKAGKIASDSVKKQGERITLVLPC